jgi:hypothetical protein
LLNIIGFGFSPVYFRIKIHMRKIIISWLILTICLIQGVGQTIQSVRFTGHTVYQASLRIFFTAASDLDKDGDQDILFTQPDQDTLQWFENQGDGSFVIRKIGVFPQAFSTWVVDIDSDGDNDILASSYTPSKVVLFENDGNQNFIFHLLSVDIPHPLTITAGDVDNDGDYDIACATQDAGKGMMMLRNDGNLVFTPIDLSSQPYSSTWVMITDLDKDGDPDILGNSFTNNGGILWYEQTAPLLFTEHLIPFANTHGFTAADLDGDGDTDLAATSCGSQVAWFENDGNNNFSCQILESSFNCAVSVAAADLDLDQETDLVASAWSAAKVDWWKNSGSGSFNRQTVSDSLPKPNCVYVADFNNDGFPDVVAGGYTGKLMWWENSGYGVGSAEPGTGDMTGISFDPETRCLTIVLAPGNSPAVVSMFSTAGVQVATPATFSNSARLVCDALKPGLYIVKLQSANRAITRKIIINP